MSDLVTIFFLLVFVWVVDVGAWIQACLIASYCTNKQTWTDPVRLYKTTRLIVLRIALLIACAIAFLWARGASASSKNLLLVVGCIFAIFYVVVAAWAFYHRLKMDADSCSAGDAIPGDTSPN